MFNPSMLMKLMNAKNTFTAAHPKFSAFLTTIFSSGIQEGDVIEITINKQDGRTITGNMRVTQSDLELLQELNELARNQ